MIYSDQIITEAYGDTLEGLPYSVSRRLASHFPDRYMIEGEEYSFKIGEYARAGRCRLKTSSEVFAEYLSTWSRHYGVETEPCNAWFEVEWKGHALDVVVMKWGCEIRQWVIADGPEIAKNFFGEVCEFTSEAHGTVLVFDGGCWQSSKLLHQAIQGMNFENLVLEPTLKTAIMNDLPRFFEAESTYKKYGIPWKRGLLLTGPPGNGKTHAIKALINQVNKPCLYVKSFAGDNRDTVESGNMRVVFERARQTAPCVLVLEDIDALINDENRSFFLNEMDGFASNEGVVTIASTNHPEKLDPAILDRPSRFDRKFLFDLPAMSERVAYIQQWNQTWEEALRLSEQGIDRAATLAEGFSFASIKELMLSATMAWIADGPHSSMDEILVQQVELMKSQNATRTTQES